MAYATTNPYTGEVLKTFPNATDAEVDQAIAAAHAAFLSWRNTSLAQRAKVMHAAAEILRKETDEYARLLTLEMGKLGRELIGLGITEFVNHKLIDVVDINAPF
jgi:succinate-semialdehyde dehydrogenase/glutarate-semialdehyde dehydrogenase